MTVASDTESPSVIVPAGRWQVDPAHSSIEFQVKHMMIATVKGRFTDFAGVLETSGGGALKAAGTVQVTSIDTDDAKRDEHLRSADFFDTTSYPELSFVATGTASGGESELRLTGELTLKGVTRPIELIGAVLGTGIDPWGNERIALELRGEVDRKDFGLTWNQSLETGGVLVSNTVKIELEISALQPAASAAA